LSCAGVTQGLIFINYRRGDTASATGRIDDHLREAFGADSVYRDIDNIPLGADFVSHIESAVARCKVVLVMIGPDWVSPRLFDENDFVRIEIEAALKLNLPIVPLLLDDATLPTADQVPPSLLPLLRRNGRPIDSGSDFSVHVERLIDGLRTILHEGRVMTDAPTTADTPRASPARAATGSTHPTFVVSAPALAAILLGGLAVGGAVWFGTRTPPSADVLDGGAPAAAASSALGAESSTPAASVVAPEAKPPASADSTLAPPTATGSTVPAHPAPAPTATEKRPAPLQPFNSSAAAERLSRAASEVSRCATAKGPSGPGRVTVKFATSGQITSATVSAPYQGTSAGDCVAKTFRKVSVPAFDGNTVTLSKSFTL